MMSQFPTWVMVNGKLNGPVQPVNVTPPIGSVPMGTAGTGDRVPTARELWQAIVVEEEVRVTGLAFAMNRPPGTATQPPAATAVVPVATIERATRMLAMTLRRLTI